MMQKKARQIGVLLFWLFLWQAAALIIDNNIVFVGPAQVLYSLFVQIRTIEFWQTCLVSLSRICLGFLSAFFTAIILGAVSFRFSLMKELLTPIMLFAKSVPVASFVILALIWMGSKNLSIFIAYAVVLPIIYASTLSGLESTDPKLLEMSDVFRLPGIKKIKAIYIPALLPYLMSGINSALGMSIKSGVAAEVIGVPAFSIGARLYTAKIYLDTADLFSWTLVIILATWLFEILFLKLIGLICPVQAALYNKREHGSNAKTGETEESL